MQPDPDNNVGPINNGDNGGGIFSRIGRYFFGGLFSTNEMDDGKNSPPLVDYEDQEEEVMDSSNLPPSHQQQMQNLIGGYGQMGLGQKQQWLEIANFAEGSVPQTMPLSANQVQNNAGGFVYVVDDRIRIRRFLILGTTGGTYYVKEQEFTLENTKDIINMIENGKGKDVLAEIKEINFYNRAPKQTPLIYCLALVAKRTADDAEKHDAYQLFGEVCRIPTHVFQFVEYAQKVAKGGSTGWGRAHRHAVSGWYTKRDPMALALAVTKYKQRNDWSHRDLLRLAHPSMKRQHEDTNNDGRNDIFLYCTKGYDAVLERHQDLLAPSLGAEQKTKRLRKDAAPKFLQFLEAVEDMKKCTDEKVATQLIDEHRLVREHVPTELLKNANVWRALLKRMPMTAMIRNLGKMSTIGILAKGSDESKLICQKLNAEDLHAARIHPFNVLLALAVYRQGCGDKGKLKWDVNNDIVNSLNEAFYMTFTNVRPTGRRFLLALDVSGSMCARIGGSALSCREASAAMAMITLRTEPLCEVVAFQSCLTELNLNKNMRLDDVVSTISNLSFGSTDCSLPMLWAAQQRKKFDCFIVYTDNETFFGDIHPSEALRLYRQKSGIWNAKLIVVGMTASKFTIADPNDPFMLDVVGFDSAAPELMRNFVLGWDSAPLRESYDDHDDSDVERMADDD